MSQRLELGVATTLQVTQSLVQSMQLLQMSNLDLHDYVHDFALSNPMIDGDSLGNYNASLSTDDADFYIKYGSSLPQTQDTMHDYLQSQVELIFPNDIDKFIALSFVNYLNDNGYLSDDIAEVKSDIFECVSGEYLSLTKDEVASRVLKVFETLRTIPPIGLFATSLKDCLSLQINDQGQMDDVFKIIISNLELIGSGKFAALAKVAKISLEEVIKRVEYIKSLNPKPGLLFKDRQYENISKVPDVFVEVQNGKIILRLNDSALPNIIVNHEYYKESIKLCKSTDGSTIEKYYDDAIRLTNFVNFRKKTLLQVCDVIINFQRDFFVGGIMKMHPMKLDDVVKATGLNESTVSRTTSNKYMHTPYGVFELKYFFSSAVHDKYGNKNVSSNKVKEMIKNIIDGEDSSKPMSDQEISDTLRTLNIEVARRTVAKYREALKILPTYMRATTKIT